MVDKITPFIRLLRPALVSMPRRTDSIASAALEWVDGINGDYRFRVILDDVEGDRSLTLEGALRGVPAWVHVVTVPL